MALLESRESRLDPTTSNIMTPRKRANDRGREAVIATENTDQNNKPLTIKAEDIATEPPVLKMPEEPVSTAATGLSAEVESLIKRDQLDRTDEIAQAEKSQSSLLQQLSSQFERIAGRGERIDAIEQQVGLDIAQAELDEITTRLESKQLANRREIERIQDAPGLTAAQKNTRITELERRHAREEADIAIVQLAKQRRFDSAQSIVDRKVSLMTEDDQNKLDALKFFYTENKDILTTEQQREFQRQLTLEERAYKLKYDEVKRLEDTKFEIVKQAAAANAPASVLEQINKADTVADAYSAAGVYATTPGEGFTLSEGERRFDSQGNLIAEYIDSGSQTVTTSSGQTYTLAELNTELANLGSQSQTLQDKTNAIDTIISEGLGSAVGTNIFQRTSLIESQYSGKRQRVIGNIENLISNEFIDSLISAKEQGATFGALSEAEMNAIISASTKIGQWRMTDDNGKVTGYNIDKDSMIEELNRIKELTNRSIQRSELKELELLEAKENAGSATTAVNLIKNEEGFRDTAYQDQAGVWTIGYGATQINGRPVQPGDTISRQEAERLLATDIARHSTFKNKVSVPLTPSQEAALQSFEFNLGSGIWDGSGILEAVNQGNFAKAGELMKQYTNAGGQPSRGLAMRRNREANLLLG